MWSVRLSTYSRRTVARGVNARVFVCACADHLSARPPDSAPIAPIRPLVPLRYSRLSCTPVSQVSVRESVLKSIVNSSTSLTESLSDLATVFGRCFRQVSRPDPAEA